MSIIIQFFVLATNLLCFPQSSKATDTITQFQPLTDGSTLVSKDESFELGFFTLGSSNNRYLGIWYHKIQLRTVVWVANRENPSKDKFSMLIINKQGNLELLSQNKSLIWSAKLKAKASNPILQLLGSGNLVLRGEQDQNPRNYLWQSFDYPSDTILPGMKLGYDFKTGLNWSLSAWKNWDDPSPGEFSYGFLLTSNPELVMWKNSTKYYRMGPWNGLRFSGVPYLSETRLFRREFFRNQDELYVNYSWEAKPMISRIVLNQTIPSRQRYVWIEEAQTWKVSSSLPADTCDQYNVCGSFGNCDLSQSPFICRCLQGFEPKSPPEWSEMDWSGGCVRSGNWSCRENKKDGFVRLSNLKVPDTEKSWVNESMTIDECKAKCWENCNCTAYANTDIRGEGSGCVIWFDNLLDLRILPNSGQDLYVRVDASKIENQSREGRTKKVAIIIASMILAMLFVIIACIYRRKRKYREKNDGEEQEELELPFFDFVKISHATNRFSSDKKLGQGGFGPVYKGTLADGQQVAVKRLSQKSGQGLQEFKNEVILCAKLQHRNLVKVLGCCIEGEEKLLIYEYMPNKSLDFFLFDATRRKLLNWPIRFQIICGIARGLLYLHQDSRLRIIHRDLKVSNILLDSELNPKISDFGLARMFGRDEIEGNTSKVVGTFGYMAPEYAFDGVFSIKSDVFSFGILLLEIITGMKNRRFSFLDENVNLIGHAWKFWKEHIPLELMDDCLRDSCNKSEVLRCIHIGLLCVQQHPDDRPNMASVVLMLSSTENSLNQPKEPSFFMEGESSDSKQISCSTNDITMTMAR